MALFDNMEDSLDKDNNKSPGTRFGLNFDPLYWLSDLFGFQDNYARFVNKSGDWLNKQASSVVKPIDKFARENDPLHKAITSTETGDKAATWITNKPATTAALLYGGISGAGALGGGAAPAGGSAAEAAGAAGAEAAILPSTGGAVATGSGTGAGSAAAAPAAGFNWQQLARQAGGNLQQQAQNEEEQLTKLAMLAPPPSVGIGQNLTGEQYAQILKRAEDQPPPALGGAVPPVSGLQF